MKKNFSVMDSACPIFFIVMDLMIVRIGLMKHIVQASRLNIFALKTTLSMLYFRLLSTTLTHCKFEEIANLNFLLIFKKELNFYIILILSAA